MVVHLLVELSDRKPIGANRRGEGGIAAERGTAGGIRLAPCRVTLGKERCPGRVSRRLSHD
jgi:hypothetical protein